MRLPADDEIADISDDTERYKVALEKISNRWLRNHQQWRSGSHRDRPGQSWSDGFHTALATVRGEAEAALNPEQHRADQAIIRAGGGTDQEWFEATGNCGGCGNIASRCDCPPSDPCGCGPHELEPWPRACQFCKGSGEHPKPPWWDEERRP